MKRMINLLTVNILFFGGMILMNCQSKTSQSESIKPDNQIVYLFFKMSNNNSDGEKITLYDKKQVNGKMKSVPVFNERNVKNGELLITLMDKNGEEIFKQNVEDPLNPELESYDGEIKKHKLNLQESEFSFRFPYSENMKTVKIEKINNSKKQLLFTQNF